MGGSSQKLCFESEVSVVGPGINGKCRVPCTAVAWPSWLNLGSYCEKASLDNLYRELLAPVKGISCQAPIRQTKRNYAYFPIFVDTATLSADAFTSISRKRVHGRRYFYPLISTLRSTPVLLADTVSLSAATCARLE